MTVDTKKLRELAADAASYCPGCSPASWCERCDTARCAFRDVADPQAVIALLDEIEQLRRACSKWQEIFTGFPHDAQQAIRDLHARLKDARVAAKAYAARVNELGMAADDNDPAVMATAEPIGEAQADLWAALGLYACDYRDEHDLVNDLPAGKRCDRDATHVIAWQDGRYSFGCADHLEIDPTATVKPLSIVPLSELRRVVR